MAQSSSSPFITLNVGGTPFTTARDTLLRDPSSRLALLARGVLPAPTAPDGALFIDRSPRWFQLVLNWLRDGWAALPASAEDRRELLQEARYYQLSSFESWLRAQDAALSASAALAAAAPPPSAQASPFALGAPSASFAARASLIGAGAGGMGGTPTPSFVAWSVAGGGGVGLSSPLSSASPPAPARASAYFSPLNLRTSTSLPSSIATPSPPRASSASIALPPPPPPSALAAAAAPTAAPDAGAFRWTRKWLETNPRAAAVVDALLELYSLAPHPACQGGKVSIAVASECPHDRMAALLGAGAGDARGRLQVLSVKSSAGWAFELALRPGCDADLYERYAIAEYLQDNLYVLAAALRDEHGIALEEDAAARPPCAACRRACFAVTLERRYF